MFSWFPVRTLYTLFEVVFLPNEKNTTCGNVLSIQHNGLLDHCNFLDALTKINWSVLVMILYVFLCYINMNVYIRCTFPKYEKNTVISKHRVTILSESRYTWVKTNAFYHTLDTIPLIIVFTAYIHKNKTTK